MFFIIWKQYLFNISVVRLKSKLWLFKVSWLDASPEISRDPSNLKSFWRNLNNFAQICKDTKVCHQKFSAFSILHSVYSFILLLDDNECLIWICLISGELCRIELMGYKRPTSEQKSPYLILLLGETFTPGFTDKA